MNNWQLLLEVTLKATIVLATVGLLGVLLRRASATTRHLVWSLALGGLLVLPVLAYLLPVWRVPVLPAAKAPVLVTPVAAENDSFDAPLAVPVEAPVASSSIAVPSATANDYSVVPRWSVNWFGVALSVWLAGVLIVLMRLTLGTLRMRRITYEAECLTDYHWSALMCRLRAQIDLPAHVSLYASEEITMPVTWGILRPIVLLPAESVQWSNEWRRIVLLHELAHIKRRDCLTQMIANWTCALYWFHPLVWFAARRLRVERELACDDYVLDVGTRASDYASYLVELAKAFDAREATSPVVVGMACSQLESRVRAILNPALKRSIPTRRNLFALALATACVLAPLASLQATSQANAIPAASPELALTSPTPALTPELRAEVIAKVAELKQQQCKLADLQAKAKDNELSAEEQDELVRVQVNLSSMREELQDRLAINFTRDEVSVASPMPLPEPAIAADNVRLSVIQPEPYPAPLKVRSGKQAAELTPELMLAIAAIQDAKQKEKDKDNKGGDQGLTADNLVRLRVAGVTPEYIESMKRAGLEDLSVRQICELKMHDVSPEFIKQAQSWSSEKLSTRDIVNLKISGVTPDYINTMKQAGLADLSIRRLANMRLMGVTPEYIAAMKRAGLDNLTADQLTQLKVQGVTEEFIKQTQNWGFGKLSARDLLQVKIHNVQPEDAQALKAFGIDNLSLRDLTNIKIHGVTAAYVKEMRDLGFDKLTLNQLLQMKIHDVTPEYIRKMRAAGFKNISANEMIKMKIQGIDTILLKN